MEGDSEGNRNLGYIRDSKCDGRMLDYFSRCCQDNESEQCGFEEWPGACLDDLSVAQHCLLHNVDLPGSDLRNDPMPSIEECVYNCMLYMECTHLTFALHNNHCWLKSGTVGDKDRDYNDVISLKISCLAGVEPELQEDTDKSTADCEERTVKNETKECDCKGSSATQASDGVEMFLLLSMQLIVKLAGH